MQQVISASCWNCAHHQQQRSTLLSCMRSRSKRPEGNRHGSNTAAGMAGVHATVLVSELPHPQACSGWEGFCGQGGGVMRFESMGRVGAIFLVMMLACRARHKRAVVSCCLCYCGTCCCQCILDEGVAIGGVCVFVCAFEVCVFCQRRCFLVCWSQWPGLSTPVHVPEVCTVVLGLHCEGGAQLMLW